MNIERFTTQLRFYKSLLIGSLLLITLSAVGQPLAMDFETKSLDGDIKPLINRLDTTKNNLIIFGAFWCSPCVSHLNNIYSKQIKNYRELYDLNVIIINDDHYDHTALALSKLKRNQWYFDMYITDDQYSSLGITTIPRYYLLPAGETIGIRMSNILTINEIQKYLLSQGHSSIFKNQISQTIINSDCEAESITSSTNETLEISGFVYHKYGNEYYRTGPRNKNIYRYNYDLDYEVTTFDFYPEICEEQTLVDADNDQLTYWVEDIIYDGEDIEIHTNINILNNCGEVVPFILSSKYGSNAGINFDIQFGQITSRLLCHKNNDALVFEATDLLYECITTSIEEVSTEYDYTLSPNPGNGIFQVENMATLKNPTIEIMDMSGNQIHTSMINSSKIDISNAPNGTYGVIIKDGNKFISAIQYLKLK